MSLKLTLKPGERVVVNGAVLTNGASKITIGIENQATILRHKDLMQPEEANTPAKRIYFQVQLAYLDPDNRDEYLRSTNQLVRDFVGAVPTAEVTEMLEPLGQEIASGKYFQALKRCKKLMAFEETRLNYGRESLCECN